MFEFFTSNIWPIFLIILFFGGSIFVHELGHFLAARRRGLVVERFSIGFGPKIVSWKRNGVEYRLSWLPLGGYVALPQLADMGAIEGATERDPEKLPPLTYSDKMIVSVMGAVFNVIFAFLLAFIIWFAGKPTSEDALSTSVGYVVPTFTLPDGEVVPSPAASAGLQAGDRIVSIDGNKVEEFVDIPQYLATGSGRDEENRPVTQIVIERDGQLLEKTLHPLLYGSDRLRQIGIGPSHTVEVGALIRDMPAQEAGVKIGDILLSIDGEKVFSWMQVQAYVNDHPEDAISFGFDREGEDFTISITPGQLEVREGESIPQPGFIPANRRVTVYPNPVEQIQDVTLLTFKTLGALLNPATDLGAKHLSGPAGIVRFFHAASSIDWRLAVWVAILVNVNLAILNLLPIPVLDGGHMVYATIAKLRGKPLPANFVATTQTFFVLLLFGFMIYVSVFDVSRWVRDSSQERSYIAPEIITEDEQE